MKVAIVHDWLTGMRGGEAILDVICELYPEADLYTLIWTDKKMSPNILNGRKIHTSYIQNFLRFSFWQKAYRNLLPLFPHAISRFDLSGYDLVLSTSSCVAKGVRTGPNTMHIAYIHSPMRYVWDQFNDYFGFGRVSLWKSLITRIFRPFLQHWDRNSNSEVDFFVANSSFVQARIKNYWQRESIVIHPFANLEHFSPASNVESKDYYLIVSAFAPYKRIDVAIQACEELGKKLIIVGKGESEAKLRGLAGPNTVFKGSLPNEELISLYQGAKAFLMPGVEDFGITIIEAMACGCPIIAFADSGVRDSVSKSCGLLYADQGVSGLKQAIVDFEAAPENVSSERCIEQAKSFSRQKFKQAYSNFLQQNQ